MATLKQLKESFHLYQLRHKVKLPVGSSVKIDGPHDKFGYIVKHLSTDKEKGHLHLIRGTGAKCRTDPKADVPSL